MQHMGNYERANDIKTSREVAPPGASLTSDATQFVARMGALYEGIVQLRDKVHGPQPRPAEDTGKPSDRVDQPLRLSLDRASGILNACENELASIMNLL